MIVAVTFSDANFSDIRKKNIQSALAVGRADAVFEFTPQDIDNDFKKKNELILQNKRGAGLWLWKPYFIKRVLNQLNEGDFLMYSAAALNDNLICYFYKKEVGYVELVENKK